MVDVVFLPDKLCVFCFDDLTNFMIETDKEPDTISSLVFRVTSQMSGSIFYEIR